MNEIVEVADVFQQTPGQLIKAARQKKQISLNDVSQKLLLSKRVLTAIDDDDYSIIPAAVYAEGYLRAYAKLLQISVDEIIKSFRFLNAYPSSDLETKVESDKDFKLCAWVKSFPCLKSFSFICIKKHYRWLLLTTLILVLLLGTIIYISKGLKAKSNDNQADVPSSVISQAEKTVAKNSSKGTDEKSAESDLSVSRSDNTLERVPAKDVEKDLNINIPLEISKYTSDSEQ